jgi:Flp pilus assembly protein TadD
MDVLRPHRPHRPRFRGAIAAVALAWLVPASAPAQSIWEDPAFVLYRQGLDALDAKDYVKAETLAREATRAYPEHVLAFYLWGQAALGQSKWQEAADALGKVTTLYPEAGSAQSDLGVAYQQLGRIEDAARAYEAALAIRPSDDESRARLAFMLVNADQVPRALDHLKALADADTKLPDVYLALGRAAYDRNDFPAAAAAFEKALTLRDAGRSWLNLGVVRAKMGNNSGAMQAFEKAAQFPDSKEQAAKEIEKLKAGPPPVPRSSRPGLPR